MKSISARPLSAIALCAAVASAGAVQAQVRAVLSDSAAPRSPAFTFASESQGDVLAPPGVEDGEGAIAEGVGPVIAEGTDAAGGAGFCASFSLQVDLMALSRSTNDRPLYSQLGVGPFPSGPPALYVPDLDFELGSRVALRLHDVRGYDLEVACMGVNQWTSDGAVAGTPIEMFNLYGMAFDAESAYAYYESELNSFEVNLRSCLCDRITLIAGMRYLKIDEELYIEDTFDTFIGPLNESMLTTTANDVFGGQFGADIRVWECCFAWINVEGKAGVLVNHHEAQSSYQTESLLLADTAAGDSDVNATFFGELAITGVYCLTPCLNLRGGYRLMWLTDVATAPQQIESTLLNPLLPAEITSDVSTEGVFFHGGFLGLEFVR